MIKQLREVAKGMKPRCDKCKEINGKAMTSKYRCCDAVFCEAVEKGFKHLGVHYERTDHPDIPFMGKNGCIVAPEHRPGCTMFFCPAALEDRKSRRLVERAQEKLFKDPVFERYTEAVKFKEEDFVKLAQRIKG